MVSGGRTNTWLGMWSPPVPIMTSQRADLWDKHVRTNGADKDVFFVFLSHLFVTPETHIVVSHRRQSEYRTFNCTRAQISS